jgi:hypothetical protein
MAGLCAAKWHDARGKLDFCTTQGEIWGLREKIKPVDNDGRGRHARRLSGLRAIMASIAAPLKRYADRYPLLPMAARCATE